MMLKIKTKCFYNHITRVIDPKNTLYSGMLDIYKEYILSKKRYNVIKGGRGGAKSSQIALGLVYLSFDVAYKDTYFMCLREYAKNIKKSSYNIVRKQIYNQKLEKNFTFIESSGLIRNNLTGVTFFFSGCQDPDGLQSIDPISILWIDEAQAVKYHALEKICPTVRWLNEEHKIHSRIFFTYNPQRTIDDVAKYISQKTNKKVTHVNIFDLPSDWQNPVLLEEAEEDCKYVDIYNWKWLGMPSPEFAPFPYENINIIETKELFNHSIAWLDPSFIGNDTTALSVFSPLLDGKIAVKGYAFKRGWKECASDIVEILKHNNCQKFAYEANALFDTIEEYYKTHYNIQPEWKVSTTNKVDDIYRASSYLTNFSFYKDDTAQNTLYIDSMLGYNIDVSKKPKMGQYDDSPDSFARGAQYFGILR